MVHPGPSGVGRPARFRSVMVMALIMAVTMLAGCVSVPTSGQVEKVSRGGAVPENENEVVPNPPVEDGSPRVIIDGFLLAMTRYQANYEIARQFLTDEAAESWRPEDRVIVYTNPTYNSSDTNVVLEMSQVGEVGRDGGYNALSQPIKHDFKMVQNADGQWRVSNPPKGLLISDTSFSAHFSAFNLYFFDPQFQTLVPDPIYLPGEGNTESALVQALLRGPTEGIRTAVSTTFPPRTAVVGNAVTVKRGLAQISLTPQVESLNEQQRIRMAAQLSWTLRQIEDDPLRGMQLTVNGTPLQVRGQVGEGQNAYLPISYGSQFDPVPSGMQDVLLGVTDGAVVMVGNDGASITPLRGQLGQPGHDISSLALSPDMRTVAAVTDDRSTLVTQQMSGGEVRIRLSEEQQLLRPDFSRYGELWAISGKPGDQEIVTIDDDKINTVQADWINKVKITDFQISPDGSRIALIASTGQGQLLAVAPIQRGERVRIGVFSPIQLVDSSSARVSRLADLGWISSTRLLILGATGPGASYEPYGVEIDGSQFERVGTSDSWGAKALTTQVEPGGSFHAVVAGRASRTWIYQSGDRWEELSDSITAVAYAN